MDFITEFIKKIPAIYSFCIGAAFIIGGAGLGLKGGSKWGWLILAIGILWIYSTMKGMGLI